MGREELNQTKKNKKKTNKRLTTRHYQSASETPLTRRFIGGPTAGKDCMVTSESQANMRQNSGSQPLVGQNFQLLNSMCLSYHGLSACTGR